MPRADLLTIEGKKAGTIVLPPEVFAAKVNPVLMAQAVRVYLANQRKARAKTKTRTEINRTKAKWYRQKGTGRARHGSRAAPIFVGGGVAHGPTGKENYKLKISKKMKKAALFSALTVKFKDKDILVVKGLEKIEPKTKKMVKIIKNLKLSSKGGSASGGKIKNDNVKLRGNNVALRNSKLKILLVLPTVMDNIIRAGRNIERVALIQISVLNTYQVLNQDKIVFMKESVDELKKTFLGK